MILKDIKAALSKIDQFQQPTWPHLLARLRRGKRLGNDILTLHARGRKATVSFKATDYQNVLPKNGASTVIMTSTKV
jgi:hypothetical protein